MLQQIVLERTNVKLCLHYSCTTWMFGKKTL